MTSNPQIPEQHREAYAEMCHQFSAAALAHYGEQRHVTMFREMPPVLQVNSFMVGTMTACLVPLLMVTKPDKDAVVSGAMEALIPELIARAREMANNILRERGPIIRFDI